MDKSIGTDRQSSSSGWGKNKIPCAKNTHAGNSFFFFFFRFRDANLSTVINEKNGRRILTSCRADKEYGPEVLSPHTQSQGLFECS